MTISADGNCWALDEWDEDTVPDGLPAEDEVDDELAALFLRKAA